MLIIWGTKVNRDPRGTVADHCPVCTEVQRFAVTDHYEVSHVYFISIGRGTRVASTRQCWACGSEFNAVPDGYDEFLHEQDAERMPLDDIVERTNAPLAQVRQQRKQLEKMASERPAQIAGGDTATQMMLPGTPLREVPTSMQDADLREALGRLEAYEGHGPEVAALLQKLQGWRGLDSAGRTALLQEVNTFIDNQQKIDRAAAFFGKMIESFPQYFGCLPAIALLVVLGSGFLVLLARDWPAWISLGYGVLGLAAVVACYFIVTRKVRRRWVRTTVIPQADAAGVDLPTLIFLMVGVANSPNRIDDKVREMAAESGLVHEELVAQGRWQAGTGATG